MSMANGTGGETYPGWGKTGDDDYVAAMRAYWELLGSEDASRVTDSPAPTAGNYMGFTGDSGRIRLI